MKGNGRNMEKQEEALCETIDDFIDRYGDMVYRVVLQHMRHEADSQDVLQDTFVKILYTKRPVFENINKEKAWVLRIAMNTCKDRWKYERIRKTVELKDQYGSEETYTPLTILPYVKQLPQKYRDVIYLFYYEEYSVREIASILGKKEATILTWLRRARKRLKVMLEGSDLYEEL